MKGVLVIIDGLGDLPVPGLGGQTPLEAAETPTMDALARLGSYGLIDPIAPGVLPNTHSGAGTLLGILPEQVDRLQRGPVEAAGLGLQLSPGDVAMRANFATVERGGGDARVVDRRAGRISSGTAELAHALNEMELDDEVDARFLPTEQHRGVLILSGPGLDARITDTDPGDHDDSCRLLPCRALDPAAQRTAELVNRYAEQAQRKLEDHPVNRQRTSAGEPAANALIFRGAGKAIVLDTAIGERGLSASVVAGCNTVRGLARLLGYRVVDDERFTADLHTDLQAKVVRVADELRQADLVYLHIKAPDICAHDRKPAAKRDFLGRIDEALAPLQDLGAVVAIAADHTTDSNTGRHTDDPVPALMFAPGEMNSEDRPAVKFGESACRDGTLPRYDSRRFLVALLDRLSGPSGAARAGGAGLQAPVTKL